MREIKFRAWDGDSMQYDVGVANNFAFDYDNESAWPWHEPAKAIMQYTGLKDKNGKEIYEGDIVYGEWGEQQLDIPKEPMIAPVVFINGCFRLDWWMKKHTLENADIGIRWREYYHNNKDRFYETTPLEVIGNIYENPELLKD